VVIRKLAITVQSKARRQGVEWKAAGELLVTAAPEAGKANAAIVSLLAKRSGIHRSDVRLVLGWTSRRKVAEVPMSLSEVAEWLRGSSGSGLSEKQD
jgi:uncharacterized protein YggU (UPF0235/DUF167 family)